MNPWPFPIRRLSTELNEAPAAVVNEEQPNEGVACYDNPAFQLDDMDPLNIVDLAVPGPSTRDNSKAASTSATAPTGQA